MSRGQRRRSELVRQALAEFLARREREGRERVGRERVAIARHRALLTRQARALVAEQARP